MDSLTVIAALLIFHDTVSLKLFAAINTPQFLFTEWVISRAIRTHFLLRGKRNETLSAFFALNRTIWNVSLEVFQNDITKAHPENIFPTAILTME